jgi:hypothetical protein
MRRSPHSRKPKQAIILRLERPQSGASIRSRMDKQRRDARNQTLADQLLPSQGARTLAQHEDRALHQRTDDILFVMRLTAWTERYSSIYIDVLGPEVRGTRDQYNPAPVVMHTNNDRSVHVHLLFRVLTF